MHELEVVKIRLVKGTSLYSDKELNSPEAVMELIAGEMALYDREVLCILNLKTDGTPINLNIVSVGTVNQAMVIPGDVFKSSILSNADHIIAVHNHPSGKILPSRSDLYITQRLRLGGELMGIPLSDHIIIGGGSGQMFSFREHGILQADPKEMEQFLRSMKKEACRER